MKNKAAQQLGRLGGKVSSETKTAAVRANGSKSAWKFKVVKKHYGMQGQWVTRPAAATFADIEDAITYARGFAAEQREGKVVGTRIVVETRGNKAVFEARCGLSTSNDPNGESRWA